MNDLPPDLSSLIERARDGHDPDPHAKHRVRAALTLSIAAATVATTATAKGLSPLVLGLLLSGGSVAVVSVAALTVHWNTHDTAASTHTTTTETTRRQHDTRLQPTDTPSSTAPSAVNTVESMDEPRTPIDRAHRSRAVIHEAAAATTQPTPDPGSTLTIELDLVTRAAKATSSQRWSDAIALLDQHAERFPSGALTEERTGLRALSLCKLQHVEGKAAAERFVRAYPSSPLIERLRTSCELP